MLEASKDKLPLLLSLSCDNCRRIVDSGTGYICEELSASINIFHTNRLELHDLGSLSDVLEDLKNNQTWAQRLGAIDVSPYVLDEEGSDVEEVQRPDVKPVGIEAAEIDWTEVGMNMAKIISHIHDTGNLESFTWKACEGAGVRPVEFWEALWKTNLTLSSLDMDFYVHELQELGDKVLPTVSFGVLKKVRLNATMSHGDTGVLVDRLLHLMPATEDLTLYFPRCDLEGCRIQDITWAYNFPYLRVLTLSTYNSDSKALSDFLLRNSTIEVLDWSVDADEQFILPPNAFLNLNAVSLDCQGRSVFVSEMLSVLATYPVKSLHIRNCPHGGYPEILKMRGTLKCLEINPGTFGWRPDSDSDSDSEGETDEKESRDTDEAVEKNACLSLLPLHKIFKDLLGKLPGLQEFALDLNTKNVWVSGGRGTGMAHPDALNWSDLVSALAILPHTGSLRALRMFDERGLPLPKELLTDLPTTPDNLEYVKWDASDIKVLYRLEKSTECVAAVECEPIRVASGRIDWLKARILDY